MKEKLKENYHKRLRKNSTVLRGINGYNTYIPLALAYALIDQSIEDCFFVFKNKPKQTKKAAIIEGLLFRLQPRRSLKIYKYDIIDIGDDLGPGYIIMAKRIEENMYVKTWEKHGLCIEILDN